MARKIKLPQFTCLRCGHTWFPRKPRWPGMCPKCKTPYWDIPREESPIARMIQGGQAYYDKLSEDFKKEFIKEG